MRKDDLQFIADTILIEEVLRKEFGFEKQADVSGMLESTSGAIKSFVQENVSSEKPGGIIGSLANIMAPAMLFRINPLIGILYLIGNVAFDVNVTDVFLKIYNAVRPALESGRSISPGEVNSIGKGVLSGMFGADDSDSADDMLSPLKEASLQSPLIKESIFGNNRSSSGTPDIPWLFPKKGGSFIQKIFGNLFQAGKRKKGKWLIGGFVLWIFKTVLAGAGLLAVAGAGAALVGAGKDKTPSHAESHEEPLKAQEHLENPTAPIAAQEHLENPTESPQPKITLVPSGRGQKSFLNNNNNTWIVPLINNNVEETLIYWTYDVYPELSGQPVENSSSFQSTLGLLKTKYTNDSPNWLAMPKQFNTRKQVVDTFAHRI